ncbi:MAG TPA: FAD-dependent oxidoreductase [Acidimicrobiales bacterium]|nr:FAD-dependent oxidoreductase [Acidimicrobiales bacterium]
MTGDRGDLMGMQRAIEAPPRSIPVLLETDVCVVGAGPAGLGASLAAARFGVKVCLVERHGFMGGNFTAASVGSVCGLYVKDGSDWRYVVQGIAKELVENLKSQAKAIGPLPFQESAVLLYVPWSAKRLFDHVVTEEQNITLLLHALVSEVIGNSGTIEAVVVASKNGPVAIKAKYFVDATGDGDLVAFSGGEFRMGESGRRQHASMQFILENADQNVALARGIPSLGRLITEKGGHLSRDAGALLPTFRAGEFIGAMTRVANPDGSPIDATDLFQSTWGELEGRRLAAQAGEFVIDNVPGFASAFFADSAPNLGIRESRRIIGQYVLTGDDVLNAARFDDAIAAGAWPQEFHVEGKSTSYVHLKEGQYYQIPYASMKPLGSENLLVAGRCLSADFEALASIRVMAPSMAIGQAAGTASAMLALDGSATVPQIQEELAKRGAFLG